MASERSVEELADAVARCRSSFSGMPISLLTRNADAAVTAREPIPPPPPVVVGSRCHVMPSPHAPDAPSRPRPAT